MLYGNKLDNEAKFYGNKLKKGIKYGSKRIANNLHKINDFAVPALALSGMSPIATGLKSTEALASSLSKI